MVNNWSTKTQNFKFTAKFPKVITHEKRLKDVDKELDHFFEAMGRLSNKTLALLIQLPHSLHIHEGLERLRELVPSLDNRFRYAIEVRHSSWFQDLTYNFFANNDICLVWSQLAELQTSPVVTTDFLYVRFIGWRSLQSPVSFCLKTTYFLVSIFVISMGDKIVSLAVDVRCSMKYTCGKTCLKGGYIDMELPGLVYYQTHLDEWSSKPDKIN